MSDPEISPSADDFDLESAILDLESKVILLKQRHEQIEADKARKSELEGKKKELQKEKKNASGDSLKSEIHFISQELDEIEVRLESQLFKWSSLSEPFWQIVRFGGVGVIIGWILKSLS